MTEPGQQGRGERDALDLAAMRRIQRGDEAALGELYDRYASVAFTLALSIARDKAEAEDIVHDAFLAVVERAEQFHPERGTVAAWLITIVRNLAFDRARSKLRRTQITDEALCYEPIEPAGDPEELMWQRREHQRVVQALGRLSPSQRETLKVAFFEGLSYPEIAVRDGVALGTVKSRAARALAELRRALETTDAGAEPIDPENSADQP